MSVKLDFSSFRSLLVRWLSISFWRKVSFDIMSRKRFVFLFFLSLSLSLSYSSYKLFTGVFQLRFYFLFYTLCWWSFKYASLGSKKFIFFFFIFLPFLVAKCWKIILIMYTACLYIKRWTFYSINLSVVLFSSISLEKWNYSRGFPLIFVGMAWVEGKCLRR